MKKLTLYSIIAALTMATGVAATTNDQPVRVTSAAEQWHFRLNGGGVTDFNSTGTTSVGVNFEIGNSVGTVILPLEVGLRQGIAYQSDTDAFLLGTRAYADFTLLSYKKVDVFAGASIGIVYGNTPLTWVGSPEVGAKYWVKKDVALTVRAEYPFDLATTKTMDKLTYVFGVEFKF